jgi:DNA-binding NtrC family response regulator
MQGMEATKKIFRIVILDDSEFFNNIFYRQLNEFTKVLSNEKNCEIEVYSFTTTADFMRNLKEDTDIAFVDYYLGNGTTGLDIMKRIQAITPQCKVIIVSQVNSIRLAALSYQEGIVDFILKDLHTFAKSCAIIEDYVNSKLLTGQQ